MLKTLRGLYAITNENLMPEDTFLNHAQAAIESGISILQYRNKSTHVKNRFYQASQLKEMCDAQNIIFIINDDIHLAKHINADGVHIGKGDAILAKAREALGPDKIIGVSCYNQLTLATKAIHQGADYIAFGRFFNSSTKPNAPQASLDLISAIKKEHNIPVCCIGGITTENCPPLINAGADMLAVINDIFSYKNIDDIHQKCLQFNTFFDMHSRTKHKNSK